MLWETKANIKGGNMNRVICLTGVLNEKVVLQWFSPVSSIAWSHNEVQWFQFQQ